MLSVIIDQTLVQPNYPRLKISDSGQIVLFTDECVGTLLVPGKTSLDRGHYSSMWAEHRFVNFYGSVTLLETKE
jgi:hypothetical protein